MTQTVKLSDITSGREIAAGGEGRIYEHPQDKNKVIKVYHQARNKNFSDHLVVLERLSDRFVKPMDIYLDKQSKVLGFSMLYVDFNNYWLFNNLFNKGFCTANNITKAFKIEVFKALKKELEQLHSSKIVVGDLNQYNIFFDKTGEVLFVDVDSYQTKDQVHSGVLLDDIRDWVSNTISSSTDIWAYDILAFWATTYCHPFKWVVPGNKESIDVRVRSNKSILSKIPGIKIPALYEAPQGSMYDQFMEIFSGRRYFVDLNSVYTPVGTVVKQPIKSSGNLIIRELFDGVTKINACDSYIAVLVNNKWHLIETKIHKVTRDLGIIDCDELYPSDNKYAYRKKDTLFSQDLQVFSKTFGKPVWEYNRGYLGVIDYSNDTQWNFNLNNQLAGIDSTMTPVFAKSFIKRSSLLQNFGSQKELSVPIGNSYKLVPVHWGTQDAIYVKGFVAAEIKNKNKVEYKILNPDNSGTSVEFDYLPYFTVAPASGLGNILMVPDDGYIRIYYYSPNSGITQAHQQFSCDYCTKDSKLYHTSSGILLLENNTLYLLNTR